MPFKANVVAPESAVMPVLTVRPKVALLFAHNWLLPRTTEPVPLIVADELEVAARVRPFTPIVRVVALVSTTVEVMGVADGTSKANPRIE